MGKKRNHYTHYKSTAKNTFCLYSAFTVKRHITEAYKVNYSRWGDLWFLNLVIIQLSNRRNSKGPLNDNDIMHIKRKRLTNNLENPNMNLDATKLIHKPKSYFLIEKLVEDVDLPQIWGTKSNCGNYYKKKKTITMALPFNNIRPNCNTILDKRKGKQPPPILISERQTHPYSCWTWERNLLRKLTIFSNNN